MLQNDKDYKKEFTETIKERILKDNLFAETLIKEIQEESETARLFLPILMGVLFGVNERHSR